MKYNDKYGFICPDCENDEFAIINIGDSFFKCQCNNPECRQVFTLRVKF